jgi:DNA-binding response OmpR family regulator
MVQPEQEALNMKSKTILIIDDEVEFAEMIRIRLEANGFHIETAPDGTAGIERASAIQPELILLDVMMPGLDGFAVLRRLRKDEATRGIPVVMLTARGEFKSIAEAQAIGAADYLIKPVETDQLLKLIRRYIK